MKSYTDIEQTRRLLEILPVESADMYFHNRTDIPNNYPLPIEWKLNNPLLSQETPCWSLTALLGLMPFQIIENNNRFGFYQVKGYNKQGETYRFVYKTNSNSFLYETSWYNEPIDAAFEMIVWLKENDRI